MSARAGSTFRGTARSMKHSDRCRRAFIAGATSSFVTT
jgi:hypothetical protein